MYLFTYLYAHPFVILSFIPPLFYSRSWWMSGSWILQRKSFEIRIKWSKFSRQSDFSIQKFFHQVGLIFFSFVLLFFWFFRLFYFFIFIHFFIYSLFVETKKIFGALILIPAVIFILISWSPPIRRISKDWSRVFIICTSKSVIRRHNSSHGINPWKTYLRCQCRWLQGFLFSFCIILLHSLTII